MRTVRGDGVSALCELSIFSHPEAIERPGRPEPKTSRSSSPPAAPVAVSKFQTPSVGKRLQLPWASRGAEHPLT